MLKSRNALTYSLLTGLFLSSWTDINGIFAELPQIVLYQPESWALGANLALVTNFGNIAPFGLILFKCLSKRQFNPVPLNYIIIIIGMVSCLLLVFFWHYTIQIGSRYHSVALLSLAFFLSLLDCTSSVTFADYIQHYRQEYTSTLFLGESLTSIIPSLLAVAQGNGRIYCSNSTTTNTTIVVYETARFSISIYFLCLFFLLTLSLISFILLQWTSLGTRARSNHDKISTEESPSDNNGMKMTLSSYILFSILCVYTSGIIFGVLLSISTYVLIPYGQRIFYLGTVLSPWMLVLVWILGMIKPLVQKKFVLLFVLLGTLVFIIDLFVCVKSPCPPLIDTKIGNFLILFVWLLTYVCLGYPRLVIANYLRTYSQEAMFWFGVYVQLGALVGSVISYILIEILKVFRERSPCENVCY
ncbi:unnamed protein product [Didymodactylos carnosus]|uniref:Riboflavin transporter n=1 Tax=Didymodactylos carnosus TaxID=1234261 RepID=A0A813RH80_9BILA|nr:unnamed protein product [Didymodactylos carnosus]CAF3564096.1 unnamed protein product [Didymodactylos carnosus]